DARSQVPAAGAAPTTGGTQGTAAAAAPVSPVLTRTGLDINSASEADLQRLPGVGKAGAKKIIAYRPFSSVDDLRKAGFSQKVIDKLRPVKTAAAQTTSNQ